jgi:hypothetical protein
LWREIGQVSAERQVAIDRMFGEFQIPAPSRQRWLLQIEELAHQIRRIVRLYHDVAPMQVGQLPAGKTALEFYDRSLALLRAGNLPGDVAVLGLQLLWSVVSDFAMHERELQPGESADQEAEALVAQYFESLPVDRFPNLVASARYFAHDDIDARFALLVEVYTAGLASVAEAGPRGEVPDRLPGGGLPFAQKDQ